MVSSVREDQKVEKIDPSLVNSYKIFLPHLKDECEEIGQKSLDLLALSKIAIGKEDKNIKTQYVKDGKEIKYAISKESLNQKYDDIKKEEDASSHKDEKQPKFVAPFLDLKKVLITPVNI
jgi:Na+/phosphate symporter